VTQKLAAEHGLRVIDLLLAFQEAYAEHPPADGMQSDNPVFADRVSHPSVLGHRLVAQVVYDYLEAEGLLARP
jgi:phospholipase/lecithinase/hemolysin